jgi:hypothetical protein
MGCGGQATVYPFAVEYLAQTPIVETPERRKKEGNRKP